MNILYICNDDSKPWQKAVHRHIPEAEFLVWGEDAVDPQDVDYVLAWKPQAGVLATFTKAKAIFVLGAGVDALLQDPTLPTHMPIVRLVDPRLSSGMTEYIVHWVLHFHRSMHVYARQQTARQWVQHENTDPAKRRIGFLGLGELGQDAAHAVLMLGFENIAGWTRTPKDLPGIESFVGVQSLDAFLARTDILVCLLPHTKDTQGLLNAATLAKLPQGAFVINAGRGSLVVEADMIESLNSGHIEAAAFDVFTPEPLSQDHPYWIMDNVFVTPHIASLTTADSATQVVAKGIQDIADGHFPDNVVDLKNGY